MRAFRKLVNVALLARLVLGVCFAWAGPSFALGQQGAPASQAVSLTTRDGVELKGAFYAAAVRPGSAEAKQVTPVILLHDHKGTRGVYGSLVQKLAASGHAADNAAEGRQATFAVLAVDLRAHGESTKQVWPTGETDTLDAAKLTKEGLFAMAAFDMEAIRGYLVDKNDAGELNLNKLCLVGSGMGASVVANWAARDWAAPPLAVGKQGQDVKALVLISPRWSFNGLSMQEPMKFAPLKEGADWLLVGGSGDSKVKGDLVRIQKQLERFHPETDKSGAKLASGLRVQLLPSKLQGDNLMKQSGDFLDTAITQFLTENVAQVQLPWSNRRGRLP
ncbi:MAG: alpha/beta fold hydrolase [Pirellulales bacterium]|nr:alpha/beta fold hydrolase [Pirellulales bacterium]